MTAKTIHKRGPNLAGYTPRTGGSRTVDPETGKDIQPATPAKPETKKKEA